MNIPFPDTDSKKYFLFWIVLVAISCSFWFMKLDDVVETGSYTFIIIFGLVVGIISGLQPVKAFQACFLGLLIFIIYLIPTGFHIFSIVFIALPSLFALTGAIFRKIVLGQEIEIHLKRWQWTLLIGGLILFGDTVALGVIQELNTQYHEDTLVRFFVPTLLGLFAAGLFTGTFSRKECRDVMKSITKVSWLIHSMYMALILYASLTTQDVDKEILLFFLMLIFLFLDVLLGTRIGCRWRKNKFIKIHRENKDV